PASFGDAAGIDNWGTMTIVDSTVSDNYAAAVQSDGGGIANEHDASLTLLNARVTGNSANAVGPFGRFVQAGGILAEHDSKLTIDGGTFEADSDATIENVQFTGNTTNITALNGDAGALGALVFLFGGENPPTLGDSSISGNVAIATAAHGAATVQGAGLVNNGQLT